MSDNGARPQGETTLAKALNAGLADALAADDHVVIMGEDVGTLGGVFRITDGLKTQFGGRRVIDSPLAESGIVGTAIGMAMRGYRPCVELQRPCLRPDRLPAGQVSRPRGRTVVPAGDDPHPVRRWCRLSGTPFGVPGGVLREHPRPQGGQLLEP